MNNIKKVSVLLINTFNMNNIKISDLVKVKEGLPLNLFFPEVCLKTVGVVIEVDGHTGYVNVYWPTLGKSFDLFNLDLVVISKQQGR